MNESTQTTVKLVVCRGETKGRTYVLEKGDNLVGRWDPEHGSFPEIDLEAHDPEAKVSRRHAVIYFTDSGVEVEDIGSLNGTFINRGDRLEAGKRHELKNGDEVIVGKTFLKVEM